MGGFRRAARRDANHNEIVEGLQRVGASVLTLTSASGTGVPDLLVGFRRVNYLLEIKDGKKRKSERQLRPEQLIWHLTWKGLKPVKVENLEQALRAIGLQPQFIQQGSPT